MSSNTSDAAAFHLVLSAPFDLDEMEASAARDEKPRHMLWRVREALDATVHPRPPDTGVRLIDRVLGRLAATPQSWAQLRRVAREIGPDDVVAAYDIDGFLLAGLAALHRKRPRLFVVLTHAEGLRLRTVAKYLGLARRVDAVVLTTESKVQQAVDRLGVDRGRTHVQRDQTDLRFFRPAPADRTSTHVRPLLYAAGLEQRDYATLAAAIEGMDVDVLVCAVSPNVSDKTVVAMPDTVPSNMTFEPLDWPEFRQAYWDADVVVVPLLDSPYSPGSTVMVEAMACQRPLVVSVTTTGTAKDLAAAGVAVGVPVGDIEAMRTAIVDLLADPAAAAAMAERGLQLANAQYSSDLVVAEQVTLMRDLARS